MHRLKEDIMTELEIKKSRFPCYLYKSFSEADAEELIWQIKKSRPSARHHCYALIIGEQNELQRSNDDEEPQGTAGVPMLECLVNRQTQDAVTVIVHYFGDIKLGVRGLIRAYSKSVFNALDQAVITQKQKRLMYSMTFSYELIGKLDHYFRQNEAAVLGKDYGEQVIHLWMRKGPLDADMAEITNGRLLPEFIEERIVDVEV